MRDISLFLFGLALLGVQTMAANLFFSGKVVVELSLVLVVYAGFHSTLVRGGMLSSLIGLVLDCLMGSVSGLYGLLYLVLFLIAKFISLRVYAEKISFIMIFVGLCAFLEGILVISFHELAFELGTFQHLWDLFLPQTIIAALLAPPFFLLFRKFEVFFNGGNTRSLERSAIR